MGMSERKYVVPDFVVDAILAAPLVVASRDGRTISLTEPSAREVARRVCVALSENPIVPTDAQIEEMKIKLVPVHPHWSNIVAEWQRRMFLAPPEPEVPSLEDVIECFLANLRCGGPSLDVVDAKMEAFRRGQKAGAK